MTVRRVDPSAALIPQAGQTRLVYVPAAETDLRKRFAAYFAEMKARKA